MTTIKFRRDTSANWTSVNPIPAQGEPCYETDTGKLKIGNGSDNYVALPYVSDGGGSSGDLPIATATTLGGIKVGNNLSITADGTLSANGGSAGTTDYTQLENKPQINSVELTGNKTLNDLGIQPKGNYQPAGDYATTADIPTKTSELTNDSGFITSVPVASSTVSGTVKVGSRLSINNGILSADIQKINVDSALSSTSVNPVQNKVINRALVGKQDTISDLTTIRSNASAGKTASDTIADYGDIVRHNASEFQASGSYAAKIHTHTKADITDFPTIPSKTSQLTNDSGFLTEAPTNMVTTNTNQTISGDKTFTRGITTTDIYPAGEITFTKNSNYRYINNIDSIAGGYHTQNGYLTFEGDTTLVGDNKLVLNGSSGGLKLTAASSADITCENTLIAPEIRTTANGTIKLTHPMNTAAGLITLSNNYGQLSISSSGGSNNNLFGVVRGTAYAIINGDNIETKDKDGNVHTFINTANIDTTYMKWDSANKKLKVDTAAVAHLAMPSNTTVRLTLGSSGTTYTAPADGYVCVGFFGNVGGNFEILSQVSSSVSYVTGAARCQCPVLKGDFSCWYQNLLIDDNLVFYFTYAVGTVPTST